MPINADKPHLWKADTRASVDQFNQWFMKFAPKAYRETRKKTIESVEQGLTLTKDLTTITPNVIKVNPGILPTLRMSTCPPLARDRLSGLVAKYYEYSTKHGAIKFWRHLAADMCFRCLGNEWFLQISPRYFFTEDGKIPWTRSRKRCPERSCAMSTAKFLLGSKRMISRRSPKLFSPILERTGESAGDPGLHSVNKRHVVALRNLPCV